MATKIQQFPFGVPGGGGLADVVDDLTPQLGGNLDLFGSSIIASNASGPEILDLASSGSVATVKPNRGTAAGLGGSGGAVDIITGAGLSGLRVGTGPGNVNTILQPLGTSGLFAGSVSGSFGLHNVAATTTVPSLLVNFLDEDTGLGGVLNSSLNAIVNGSSKMQWGTSITTFAQSMAAAASGGPQIRNNTATLIGPVFNPHSSLSTSGIGGDASGGVSMVSGGTARIVVDSTGIGFFATTPAARPTGVAVTDVAIHAALVTLGLITA